MSVLNCSHFAFLFEQMLSVLDVSSEVNLLEHEWNKIFRTDVKVLFEHRKIKFKVD